jgi:hypothetical protein
MGESEDKKKEEVFRGHWREWGLTESEESGSPEAGLGAKNARTAEASSFPSCGASGSTLTTAASILSDAEGLHAIFCRCSSLQQHRSSAHRPVPAALVAKPSPPSSSQMPPSLSSSRGELLAAANERRTHATETKSAVLPSSMVAHVSENRGKVTRRKTGALAGTESEDRVVKAGSRGGVEGEETGSRSGEELWGDPGTGPLDGRRAKGGKQGEQKPERKTRTTQEDSKAAHLGSRSLVHVGHRRQKSSQASSRLFPAGAETTWGRRVGPRPTEEELSWHQYRPETPCRRTLPSMVAPSASHSPSFLALAPLLPDPRAGRSRRGKGMGRKEGSRQKDYAGARPVEMGGVSGKSVDKNTRPRGVMAPAAAGSVPSTRLLSARDTRKISFPDADAGPRVPLEAWRDAEARSISHTATSVSSSRRLWV